MVAEEVVALGQDSPQNEYCWHRIDSQNRLVLWLHCLRDLSIILCQRLIHEGSLPSNSIAKRLKTAPQSLKG